MNAGCPALSLREHMPRITGVAVGILASVVCFSPATAQTVRGHVVEADGGAPIMGAAVTLLDADDAPRSAALSDSAGWFQVVAPEAGRYRLRVEHISYQSALGKFMELHDGDQVEVEIRLGIHAIPLEPIVVLQHARAHPVPIEDFVARMNQMREVGLGTFITRDEIQKEHPQTVSDLLQGVGELAMDRTGPHGSRARITSRRGGACWPAYYVDGSRLRSPEPINIDEYVTPADVEGIEIYKGLSDMPAEFYDPMECGAIVIWTRRSMLAPDHPLPAHAANVITRPLAALGLALLLVFVAGLR
jgi:Carboxypeptidase regulatory-like domain/TonB-dependent Receptor Plug Domain